VRSRGFTLLEVLVAIAILGIGLTTILGTQVGLFSSASRAEHLTVAVGLARCHMSEVERELLREGFPLLDDTDEGPCCEEDGGEGVDGYRCLSKVERIELPDPEDLLENEDPFDDEDEELGPLALLQELQQAPTGDAPSSLQDLAQRVGESASAAGLGPLAMSMVYPDLKPMLEASIRRVTVKVVWKEGIRERDLSVTQFVTYPQLGLPEELGAGDSIPDEDTTP